MIDVPRELVDLVEEHGFQSEWNALIDSIAELEDDRDVHKRHHEKLSKQVIHLKRTMAEMKEANNRKEKRNAG